MSEVPSEVQEFAAKQMLQTIYGERAKFKVQKITNGHTDNHVCENNGKTYAQKEDELLAAEQRLRDEYGELLV